MPGKTSKAFLRALLHIKLKKGFLVLAFLLAADVLSAQDDLEIVVQKGHSGLINAMAFSRDSRFLVTGGSDQLVKLWDLKTGREIRTFVGHDEAITEVVIDVEQNMVLSAAGNARGSEIFTWNIFEQDRDKRIKAGHAYNLFKGTLEWSFEIKTLAVAGNGDLFWGEDHLGVQMGKITQTRGKDVLKTDWQPNHISMSPSGNVLAAGGDVSLKRVDGKSNEVRIWSYPSLESLYSLETPNESVNRIKFSSDSKTIAGLSTQHDTRSDTYSNVVSIFDVLTGEKRTDVKLPSSNELFDFAYSPDGKLIAIPLKTDFNGTQVVVIDVATRQVIDTLDTREGIINRIGFSPDGRLLVTCGSTINFWDVPTFKAVREISFPQQISNFWLSDDNHIIGIKQSEVKLLQFDLDLSTIKYSGTYESALSAIAFNGKTAIQSRDGTSSITSSNRNGDIDQYLGKIEGWSNIRSLELSESGKIWAAIGDVKEVAYQVADTEIMFLEGHKKRPLCIAINEKSNLIATGGEDNKVILWDLKTGQKLKEFVGHNNDIRDLDFNSDGTMLASCSEDWNVKLWDVKNKSLVKTLLGHQSDVLTIDFNESGELLASGSGDEKFGGKSEVIIWDVNKRKKVRKFIANDGYVKKLIFKDGRLYSMGNDPTIQVFETKKFSKIYSLIPVDDNDFTIFTPENYYTTTKMPEPLVHFVQGLKVIHFENFDLKYNRPDLVLGGLGSGDQSLIEAMYSTYRKRIAKLGLEEQVFKGNTLPEVLVLGKEKLPLTVQGPSISFSVELKAPKSALSKLNVWVNNIPLYGVGGLPIEEDQTTIKDINLELSSGRNVIDVSCTNISGVESYKESFEIVNLQEKTPRLYLITVGVSQYKNKALNLEYAAKDASDIAAFFMEAQGYAEVVIHQLLNEEVNLENFLTLKEQLRSTDVNDHIILFMAGHGVLDENFDFNFAAYDIDIDDPSKNGITFNMIENLVDSIPARKKMVLIDACHSGAIDKEEIDEVAQQLLPGSRDPGVIRAKDFSKLRINAFKHFGISNNSVAMMEQMFNDLGNGTGAVIISAAAGNSYALESPQWSNGVFTYSLLKGMKTGEADLDGNGEIAVSELREYVSETVFDLTDGKQRSTSRKENYKLNFVVVK